MITGFNTDVRHEGHLYHVQTEDRGKDNPILESLVYVGGTIVAKKLTPYSDQLRKGATEEGIASLLKRQHQVIIAAIRAGRLQDLIRHSQKEQGGVESPITFPSGELAAGQSGDAAQATKAEPPAPVVAVALPPKAKPSQRSARTSGVLKTGTPATATRGNTGGLNFDQVIADHLKRNSDQARLDVSVL